jgi:F-type H+-transporting ATPase subunit b
LEVLSNLGINLGYLLVQISSFFIMLLVLTAWVYKPLVRMIEQRRESINQGLEDARVAAEARANAEQEAEKILAEARVNASQAANEIAQRAEEQVKDIKKAAEAEAVEIREEALAEIQQERDRVLGEVRGQVITLALAAAHKLVGEALDEQRQRSLIEEFFSGVKAGRVTVLTDESLVGDSALVTSALPLTEGEQDTVRNEVLAQLGETAEINFEVNPNILGGLVLRVGDKVMDGSVASQIEGLRKSLS